MAVVAKVAETDTTDAGAFARVVGKRIQATYGAKLRRMADDNPQMGAQELFERVIVPAEFPYATVENPIVVVDGGARDRARKARPNAESPAEAEQPPDWREHLAAARLGLDAPSTQRKPLPMPVGTDPNVNRLREALDEGIAEYQRRRRERLAKCLTTQP